MASFGTTTQGNSFGLPRSPWWGTKTTQQNPQSLYGWPSQQMKKPKANNFMTGGQYDSDFEKFAHSGIASQVFDAMDSQRGRPTEYKRGQGEQLFRQRFPNAQIAGNDKNAAVAGSGKPRVMDAPISDFTRTAGYYGIANHESEHAYHQSPEYMTNREVAPGMGDAMFAAEEYRRTHGVPLEANIKFPEGMPQNLEWMRQQAAQHGYFDGASMQSLLSTPEGRQYLQQVGAPAVQRGKIGRGNAPELMAGSYQKPLTENAFSVTPGYMEDKSIAKTSATSDNIALPQRQRSERLGAASTTPPVPEQRLYPEALPIEKTPAPRATLGTSEAPKEYGPPTFLESVIQEGNQPSIYSAPQPMSVRQYYELLGTPDFKQKNVSPGYIDMPMATNEAPAPAPERPNRGTPAQIQMAPDIQPRSAGGIGNSAERSPMEPLMKPHDSRATIPMKGSDPPITSPPSRQMPGRIATSTDFSDEELIGVEREGNPTLAPPLPGGGYSTNASEEESAPYRGKAVRNVKEIYGSGQNILSTPEKLHERGSALGAFTPETEQEARIREQVRRESLIEQGASPYDTMSPMEKEAERIKGLYETEKSAADRAEAAVGRGGRVVSNTMTPEDRVASMPHGGSDLGARGAVVGGPYGSKDADFFRASEGRLKAKREAADRAADANYEAYEQRRAANEERMRTEDNIENPRQMKMDLERLNAKYHAYKKKGGMMDVRSWYQDAYDRGMIKSEDVMKQIQKNYGDIFADGGGPVENSDWDAVASGTAPKRSEISTPTRDRVESIRAAQQKNLQRRNAQEAAQADARMQMMQMQALYNMGPEAQAAYFNSQGNAMRGMYESMAARDNANAQRDHEIALKEMELASEDKKIRLGKQEQAEQWYADNISTLMRDGNMSAFRDRARAMMISSPFAQYFSDEQWDGVGGRPSGINSQGGASAEGAQNPIDKNIQWRESIPEGATTAEVYKKTRSAFPDLSAVEINKKVAEYDQSMPITSPESATSALRDLIEDARSFGDEQSRDWTNPTAYSDYWKEWKSYLKDNEALIDAAIEELGESRVADIMYEYWSPTGKWLTIGGGMDRRIGSSIREEFINSIKDGTYKKGDTGSKGSQTEKTGQPDQPSQSSESGDSKWIVRPDEVEHYDSAIRMRFNRDLTPEQRQQILDEHGLISMYDMGSDTFIVSPKEAIDPKELIEKMKKVPGIYHAIRNK